MTKLRIASSVVLTREQAGALEVFLVRRSEKLRFFGGFHAFPGGVQDPTDRRASDPDPGHEASQRCALRELFEEVGVLPAPLSETISLSDRAALRQGLLSADGEAAGCAFQDRTDDRPKSLAALRPICQITTPTFAPVRYETSFLHCSLPEGETPTIIPGELVEGRFVRPDAAIAEWVRGEIDIAPPVLFLLGMMVDATLDEFFNRAADETEKLRRGRPHAVYFTPGILLLPLETKTLPPATTTNCLLVGEERVYVVDPAPTDPAEQERLVALLGEWRTAGRRLEAVLLTHHHPDHVGAVDVICKSFDLPLLAHPRTLDRVPGGARQRELADGDRLPLGAAPDATPHWELEVCFTPGHAQGHLAFVDSRYRAAIVGDLISTVSTIVIDPPEGHLATYLASLERMRTESIGTLYPAHGPAVRDGDKVLRRYLEHRREREDKLVAALRANEGTVSALLPLVYDDVDPQLHALAERSMTAGLEKLEEEGRARRDAQRWTWIGT